MTAPVTPQLYILAGPNGVGKTTYARRFLPAEVQCLEFVNADMIAQGLSPFAPERATIRAGRLMLARLDELITARASFAFETTLSGRGYCSLLRAARAAGYCVHLDFLWLPSLTVTRSRVAQRVQKGGHNIPEPVQERRFLLGLQNLFTLYRPLVDHWRLFDNSGPQPLCLAEEQSGRLLVHVPALFDKLPFTP